MTALEGRDTAQEQGQEQLKEGTVFPAMQRCGQVALGELRGVLAVVTFGICVQSLNH